MNRSTSTESETVFPHHHGGYRSENAERDLSDVHQTSGRYRFDYQRRDLRDLRYRGGRRRYRSSAGYEKDSCTVCEESRRQKDVRRPEYNTFRSKLIRRALFRSFSLSILQFPLTVTYFTNSASGFTQFVTKYLSPSGSPGVWIYPY